VDTCSLRTLLDMPDEFATALDAAAARIAGACLADAVHPARRGNTRRSRGRHWSPCW
jgi:hypothetical protein